MSDKISLQKLSFNPKTLRDLFSSNKSEKYNILLLVKERLTVSSVLLTVYAIRLLFLLF